MTVIFCPKCHRLVAQVVKDDNGVKVMQGEKVLISLGGSSSKGNKISVNCPNGHPVEVET